MPTYISFLRGINVGGHKKVVMSDLRQLYENAGFTKILTYIQSGNVVFDSSEDNRKVLKDQIETAIVVQYGFAAQVILKTKAELDALLATCPYKNDDVSKIYFTLLSDQPDEAKIAIAKTIQHPPERFSLEGDVIVLYCENGYGKTKLTNTFFESKLKLAATTRNWNTISELARLSA